MLKYGLAAALMLATAAPVMSAEDAMYYVVREGDKDCKISEKAPTEWEKATILGEYGTKAEAQKKMKVVCGAEPPKKVE